MTLRCLSILLLAAVAGCNIITPAAYIIEGPDSNEAQYTLPDRRTVIFVDDRQNKLARTQLRSIIGDRVATDLMRKDLVTETIASRDAIAVARREETAGKPLSIEDIGRKVGAEVVIYVQIGGFNLSEEGNVPRPNGYAMVKVIDVTERRRLFPSDPEQPGVEVDSTMREVSMDLYNSPSGRRSIEEQLAENMGDRIAKVFYKHEKNELGKGTGVRK